jgi:cytochrome c556
METIKDAETFKATFPGVLKNCNACHETYRKKE